MIAALRKLDNDEAFGQAETIDREYEKSVRREKYEYERDAKHQTVTLTDSAASHEPDADTRLIFWDILRDSGNETALYLVLRHCMGYSMAEIAAGMGVTYSRVKYAIDMERKRQNKRQTWQ